MRHSRALSQGVAAFSVAVLVAAAMAGPADGAGQRSQQNSSKAAPENYLVLTDTAAGATSVAAQLRSQGAEVTSVNKDVGLVVATSDAADFREQAADIAGVRGVAAERVIGRAPVRDIAVEQENLRAAKSGAKVTNHAPAGKHAAAKTAKAAKADPLDANLWGMRMIKADQAHTRTLGSPKVKVGIMDTGVQADHPDLHANFDYKTSRNFVTDIPFDSAGNVVDGPCESPNSCVDPVGTDDGGHGTHVAGTVAAALDGFGLSGVAPKASIVEVRAGQDSGYFFAGPTVNALTYSGDAGLDVVNMSFYVDPWLYNCQGGAPEDTPEQAQDQNVIIATVQRALDYAHDKGVTLVAAAGNQHQDLADPKTDATSPDFPAGATHPRTIDPDKCLSLPTEGHHVLGVTALGPSEKKADYSNWTTKPRRDEVELSAPGGWFRDGFGTPSYRTNQNEILSTYPLKSLQEEGSVDENGNITPQGTDLGIVKECQANPAPGTSACGYYAWLQGTSMASPHAAGVAALAVSAHGKKHGRSGFGMNPDAVQRLLERSATDHACPAGRVQDYLQEGRDATFTARCEGGAADNGFYGEGIVNAWGVVR